MCIRKLFKRPYSPLKIHIQRIEAATIGTKEGIKNINLYKDMLLTLLFRSKAKLIETTNPRGIIKPT
jgi:hypothetical protein